MVVDTKVFARHNVLTFSGSFKLSDPQQYHSHLKVDPKCKSRPKMIETDIQIICQARFDMTYIL